MTQRQDTCLVCVRPWVKFLALKTIAEIFFTLLDLEESYMGHLLNKPTVTIPLKIYDWFWLRNYNAPSHPLIGSCSRKVSSRKMTASSNMVVTISELSGRHPPPRPCLWEVFGEWGDKVWPTSRPRDHPSKQFSLSIIASYQDTK